MRASSQPNVLRAPDAASAGPSLCASGAGLPEDTPEVAPAGTTAPKRMTSASFAMAATVATAGTTLSTAGPGTLSRTASTRAVDGAAAGGAKAKMREREAEAIRRRNESLLERAAAGGSTSTRAMDPRRASLTCDRNSTSSFSKDGNDGGSGDVDATTLQAAMGEAADALKPAPADQRTTSGEQAQSPRAPARLTSEEAPASMSASVSFRLARARSGGAGVAHELASTVLGALALGERAHLLFEALRPDSSTRSAWDRALLWLVTFSAYAYPFWLMYLSGRIAAELAPPLFAFTLFVDVFFLADIGLNMVTPYKHLGFWIEDPRLMAEAYMRSWFVADLLASVPFDWFAPASMPAFWQRLLACSRVLRVLRAIKLIMRKGVAPTNSSQFVQRIVLVLTVWVMFAHWCAIVFYIMGVAEGADGWIARTEEMAGATRWEMYVAALHYCFATMTPMGYADVRSHTWREKMVSVSMQIFGAIIYGTVFGNISAIISRFDQSGRKQQVQLDLINEFTRFHDVSPALKDKMIRYTTFLYSVNGGFDIKSIEQLSAAMPPTVSAELYMSLHEELVRSVPMFAECDDAFIKALVMRLHTQAVLAGDWVFHVGDFGDTMYFVGVGLIDIISSEGNLLATLGSGRHFGELAMLTAHPRLAGARAAVDTLLYTIGMLGFDEVVKFYPQYIDTILGKAKEAHARLTDERRLNRYYSSNLGMLHSPRGEGEEGEAAPPMPGRRQGDVPSLGLDVRTCADAAADAVAPLDTPRRGPRPSLPTSPTRGRGGGGFSLFAAQALHPPGASTTSAALRSSGNSTEPASALRRLGRRSDNGAGAHGRRSVRQSGTSNESSNQASPRGPGQARSEAAGAAAPQPHRLPALGSRTTTATEAATAEAASELRLLLLRASQLAASLELEAPGGEGGGVAQGRRRGASAGSDTGPGAEAGGREAEGEHAPSGPMPRVGSFPLMINTAVPLLGAEGAERAQDSPKSEATVGTHPTGRAARLSVGTAAAAMVTGVSYSSYLAYQNKCDSVPPRRRSRNASCEGSFAKAEPGRRLQRQGSNARLQPPEHEAAQPRLPVAMLKRHGSLGNMPLGSNPIGAHQPAAPARDASERAEGDVPSRFTGALQRWRGRAGPRRDSVRRGSTESMTTTRVHPAAAASTSVSNSHTPQRAAAARVGAAAAADDAHTTAAPGMGNSVP